MAEPVQFELALRRADAAYQPGDWMEGAVTVVTSVPMRCAACSVGLRARFTPVRQDVNTPHEAGVLSSERIATDIGLRAGETVLPFRIRVPWTVRDYRGQLFKTDFELQADARLNGIAVARLPIRVTPRTDPGLHLQWSEQDITAGHGALSYSTLGILGSLLLLGGAVYVESTLVLALAVAIFILSVAGVVTTIKPWLAERRSGRLRIELDTPEPGRLRVRLHAPNPDRLSAVTTTFAVEEFVRRAAPDRDTLEWVQPLVSRTETFEPAADGTLEAHVMLPEAGQHPYPIEIGSRSSSPATAYAIDWRLRVHATIPKWADWDREIPLKARPSDVPFEDE